jgi:glycosyltransferase involved in cell wall biosynthesis
MINASTDVFNSRNASNKEASRVRIAIDARMIRQGQMHGIARYVDQLLRHIRVHDRGHEYFILAAPGTPLWEDSWPTHMNLIPTRAKWISVSEQWLVPQLLRRMKADLFHAPSYVAPLFCPCRLVMTIHDLNHLVLPQFYTPIHQIYYHAIVRNCIKHSELLLTVSDFSRDEIVTKLDVPAEKIVVTHNGVSPQYHREENAEVLDYVRDIYELPSRFVFCLANNKPHKNLQQLVRAYCYSHVDIPLVLASPFEPEIMRIAEAFNKKHLIHFVRFIEEKHLPLVYSLTDLFVFPSTYEGFGLPPLEAMACGVPVVVARSASLPEVVGEAAIFVDPFDFRDMARGIEQGVNDTSLRQRLSEIGPKHATRFSWERMSEQTLDVYDRCLAPPTHSAIAGRI